MVNKDKIALHWKIVLALVLGVIIGAILQLEVMADWSQQIAAILKFGASIFLRLLKMVVVPLVASSLFVGVTSVASNRDLGKIGLRTAFYYITTSTLAIGIGLLMVNLIQPGKGAKLGLTVPALTDIQTPGSLWDILLRMIPTNPVAALAQFDMIGIIFFSILFAVFTTTLQKSEREPVVRFFNSFYKVMMKIVHSIIALAPYGVFCLIANLIATTGFAVFVPLFKYLVTVTLALAVHFFIILPLIAKFFAGKNPLNYLTAMAPALLTAFSSASSAATLPLTMECAEKRGAIPSRITHLVLPLGATVNMDG
ncbi:MAG: dicarboxylate/amino acid:cation symporter, partial [Bdellovibrionales bacterium]|nr:dicarboxylate/amino acid:cation symporter [Bdellovibrionales bacterium]